MEKKISKRVCSNSSQWRKSHGFHTERDARFTLEEIIWEGHHNATPSSSTKEALVSELIVLGVGETTSPTSKESGPAIFTETRQAYPLQCRNFTFRNLSSKSTHAQRYTHDSVDLSTAHSSKSRGMPTEVQIHSWKVGTLEKKKGLLSCPPEQSQEADQNAQHASSFHGRSQRDLSLPPGKTPFWEDPQSQRDAGSSGNRLCPAHPLDYASCPCNKNIL